MLSSGTRITIVMLVGVLALTAAYWIFLADPGPDPLRILDEDDQAFIDDLPDDAPELDSGSTSSAGVGRSVEPPVAVQLPTPEPDLEPTPSVTVPADSAGLDDHRDGRWNEPISRPWETLRRVSPTGPVRVRDDEFGSAGTVRPSVGDDARDPDAGKDGGSEPIVAPDEVVAPQPPAPTPGRTPAGTPDRTEASAWGEHVVAAGDTVVAIAERWFKEPGNWDLILRANPGVDPTRLSIGQRLRLPPRDWRPAPAPPTTSTDLAVHEVRPGETLIVISRLRYGTDEHWRAIYEANRATIGTDPGRLQVGMKLRIPRR